MQTPRPQITVAEDLESVAPHVGSWDALALARERPFCAPAWMLAWWDAYRTEKARLRVILAHEDGRLVCVAPFFANRTLGLAEMRLLSAGFSHRIGILAERDREELLAPEIAAALAGIRPAPASVVFEGVDGDDPWPRLIAAHWPGPLRPAQRTDGEMQAPVIHLGSSYDEWMERRKRTYRKEARRQARRLEEQGVSARVATDAGAIDTLLELHHARWSERGGSNVDGTARTVLADAARRLASAQRMFVALLEEPNGPVAAELVLCSGRTAAFWGGGFDPRWAQHAPGMQAMLFTLRHLAKAGTETADLGGGEHDYKQRMADETTTLAWRTVFPRGWRYPLIRLRLAPKHLRLGLRKAVRRLPHPWQEHLERVRRDMNGARA